jgi:hypothetical protein
LRAYFDSGLLFKLYWQEPNTPAAQAIDQQYQPPILLSRFNEVEIGFDRFVTADKQQHEFAVRTGIHSVHLPP